MYADAPTRRQLFELMELKVYAEVGHCLGRLGMKLWSIVVLAVFKQRSNICQSLCAAAADAWARPRGI